MARGAVGVKASGRLGGAEVVREAAAYSQRLALKMIELNVTKAPVEPPSKIFAQATPWDQFIPDHHPKVELRPMLAAAQRLRVNDV